MSGLCYRLCDLIDITEELLAVVRSFPEGAVLEDPLERGVFGVPVELVKERLQEILHQLVVEQKGLE